MQKKVTLFSLYLLLVVSSGGLLFGYHTAIFSGILTTVAKEFNLSLADEGILVSIVLLGGLVGALLGGYFADKWGRKKVLISTAALFCISGILQALSTSYSELLAGRFLAGMCVGLSSVLSPMYLAEIAPPAQRGGFVSSYQFMVATGILWAYAMNMLFDKDWRLVFYIGIIPSLLQLIALFFIPESPSWLHKKEEKKREDKAVTTKLDPHLKRLLIIGLLLSIFQQITGVNTVFYYAPKVLVGSGAVSASHALGATVALGIINLFFTCVAIAFLDRFGRRLFLIAGVLLMLLGQILLALSFLSPIAGVAGVISYVVGFSIGLGPITWVLLSEIFPLSIRGKAIGVSLFANWLANYAITLTFLLLLKALGISWTFTMYGLISLLCLSFIYFLIPETKGKTLEEIEVLAKSGKI